LKTYNNPGEAGELGVKIKDGMHLLMHLFGPDASLNIGVNIIIHLTVAEEMKEKGNGVKMLKEIIAEMESGFPEALEAVKKEHPEILEKIKEAKERREIG
jgi:hypothetical protein